MSPISVSDYFPELLTLKSNYLHLALSQQPSTQTDQNQMHNFLFLNNV